MEKIIKVNRSLNLYLDDNVTLKFIYMLGIILLFSSGLHLIFFSELLRHIFSGIFFVIFASLILYGRIQYIKK